MMSKIFQYSYIAFSILFVNSCNNLPVIDDSKVFRLNRYENISSLDPAFARSKSNNWMSNLLYTGLVNFDNELNVIPEIAKKWDISDDGKIYTFQLRNDVYFHPHESFGQDSTRVVVAQDFMYSFDRLTNPEISSSGGFVLNNVERYDAINDSTFQVELKAPFPPFLGLLCMKYCSVVPEEVFGNPLYKNEYIGTGPFSFKFWENNVKLVLQRNPLFYKSDDKGNQLPYLEYVAVQFLPEKHSEFLQLIQGKVDMMASLDPSYKDELLTPQGELNPKYEDLLVMQKSPYLNTEYLSFYLEDGQSIPEILRKAINMAIDKSKMIQYLRNNIGFPAHGGFIPKGLPGHQAKLGDGYNPNEAKRMIEKYRLEHSSLPSLSLVTTQEYADICEFVQSELNKVSFPIGVNVVDPGTLRDGKANGKFNFFRANWGADYPDAENFLSLFYSQNFAPNGPNYSHFKSEEFDKLYLKSLHTVDDKERVAIYEKMDEIIMDATPVIPTFYDQSTIFLNKNVHGFESSAINMLDLTRVYKTKD